MVIKVVDKKFHRETMKKINSYYDKSSQAYDKGDMPTGKFWEKKADSLYGKSYGRMFGLKKVNGSLVNK